MLAFVLGPMFEGNLRQSLLMSYGNFLIFLNRPISAVFVSLTAIVVLSACLPFFRKRKATLDTVARED
jgi:putative tricarboxylic transport membrane protein